MIDDYLSTNKYYCWIDYYYTFVYSLNTIIKVKENLLTMVFNII